MRLRKTAALMAATGAAAFLLPQIQAGTFNANFNDNAVPAGTYLNGVNGGGVIEAGVLKITKTAEGQFGGFVIEDLDATAPVYGLNFTAKVRVDSAGTPADGFSLNFGPDISETTGTGGELEDGVGSGLRVSFDTYSNAGEFPPSPSISLRLGGNTFAYVERPAGQILTGPTFADISVNVTVAGAVTLTYKGETIFNNVMIPGYDGVSSGRFAIAGRTGGAFENVWFDDISLTTLTGPSQVGVGVPPQSITVLPGTSVTFEPILNNAQGATFQWLKNGATLAGETGPTLTIASPTLADSGTRYSLRVTGPNNTVTSSEATLTVTDITATPTVSFDFTDPNAPAGTVLLSGALGGGYIQDGILHLTDDAPDNRGVFIVDDLNSGAAVYGLTAQFKLRIATLNAVAADGFSFNFAPDITDTTNGDLEEGLGTGLTVTFDIYDNGGGEAPSIDVKYGGVTIAQRKVDADFLSTGEEFADIIIRLENDGTLDVVGDGTFIFQNVTLPGFVSMTGGRVALAARTGGSSADIWVDDLSLATLTTPGDLRLVTQPRTPQFALVGQTITLTAAVNDETDVTYQWFRNGAPIEGATSATYTFTAAAGDNNAQYTVRATKGGLNATSAPATLIIVPITPTVTYDFNSGTTIPAGVIAAGTVENAANPLPGYISETGGVNDSGVFHLTDMVNGQSSALVIQPLHGGAEVGAITAAFDILLRSGGTPADGFSFNWDDNLPDTTISGAENGTGNGLTIQFGIYNGGTGGSIAVRWNGATLATTRLTFAEMLTGDSYRKVIINLTADGKLDLSYGDRVIHTDLQLPGFAPITNGKFAFYARTGGLNADQWIDNIQIQAVKTVAPLRITSEPSDILGFPGSTATFSAVVSDPTGVTYQWSRNGAPITGATSASYTTPALTLTDNNATYTLTATGPSGTATSRAAVAHVVEPFTGITNPDVSFNFDDGATPEGTTLYGDVDENLPDPGQAGYITTDGGVNNSGVVHLTDSVNGQGGTFYVRNFDGEQAVSAFTANFKIRIDGPGTPADGVSFNWATDLNPDGGTVLGPNGGGTGLILLMDTFLNAGEQAPEFELFWQGTRVALRPVPIDWMTTGDQFADVFIRVEADGTVDVQYEGRPIFGNVQLPNFTPQTGAHFAIAARTGGLNSNHWIDDVKIVTTSGVTGPTMSIARNQDGTLRIEWAGGGTLESAPTVLGPWNPVTGASSPATVTTSGQMQFFRVAQPAP